MFFCAERFEVTVKNRSLQPRRAFTLAVDIKGPPVKQNACLTASQPVSLCQGNWAGSCSVFSVPTQKWWSINHIQVTQSLAGCAEARKPISTDTDSGGCCRYRPRYLEYMHTHPQNTTRTAGSRNAQWKLSSRILLRNSEHVRQVFLLAEAEHEPAWVCLDCRNDLAESRSLNTAEERQVRRSRCANSSLNSL